MINRLFKNNFALITLQFIALLIFILLIYGSIGITTQDADFAKILRNTNLANLIVWSYWWPMIIVTAIFFGRYWCSICPMELITSLFGKIGFRKKPGKFLKTGWVITLFYAIIIILGLHTFAIHRVPQYMAIYMLVLFVVAALVGYIWEKRTFCTYVCPIGHLLGLYSLFSFSKLRVKSKEVCKSCTTKDCIHKNNHYKAVGRSCTSELYPPQLNDNRDCILCGQCFKSCTKDNIIIQKRRFAEDLFSTIQLKWAEMGFFVIISGFVVYEILSEWSVSKQIIIAPSNFINQTFDITGSAKGTIKALVLFVFIPLAFYLLFAIVKKIWAKESWKNGFSQLVLAILPITASMHILKAVYKTTSRIPYWEYAITDPKGIDSAKKIMQNPELIQNNYIISTISPVISILSVLLPILGLILSFYVIKKQNHKNSISKLLSAIAVLLYASIFIITMVMWKLL